MRRFVTFLRRAVFPAALFGCALLLYRGPVREAAAAEPALTESDRAFRRMTEERKRIYEYMVRRADALSDRAASEIHNTAAWEAVRDQRHTELREMLGLLPWPKRTPLEVQNTGRIDRGDYTIEKIAFQSVPGFYVTANLYLPKRSSGPLPAVIYVCGHNGGKALYQHHGVSFAKNGYAAFLLDPIQNSEVFAVHAGIRAQEMFDWYSRGFSPGGVEAWNAIRAIDYLETRPEIDKERIGMTGFSGGDYMTFFTAALDPRIQVAAPFMGISTYSANIRLELQQVHCDCMYPINSYQHDLLHLGALIAPRPLLVGQGKEDFSFPALGYERFRREVGRLYGGYGQASAFAMVELDSGHEDTEVSREHAIRWFDQHLLGVPQRKLDLSFETLPDEQLAVFSEGPPPDAQNDRVHETFIETARPQSYTSLEAWRRRRSELLGVLRAKVLPSVPSQARDVRVTDPQDPGTLPKWFHRNVRISSADTVEVRAMLRDSATPNEPRPGVLYAASDGDDPRFLHLLLWGQSVPNTWPAVVVFPRGVSEVGWSKSVANETLRSAMVIGETVDSMRLADVLVGLEVLMRQRGVDPRRVIVIGRGVSGALAMYAAILDERISEVVVTDPPATHAQAPIFLNVLRYTDLPEAAALLAPRRLSFYRRLPEAYSYTRQIYELYGEADRFSQIAKVESE